MASNWRLSDNLHARSESVLARFLVADSAANSVHTRRVLCQVLVLMVGKHSEHSNACNSTGFLIPKAPLQETAARLDFWSLPAPLHRPERCDGVLPEPAD